MARRTTKQRTIAAEARIARDDDRIVTEKDLRKIIPLNRSTIHRMVQRGAFPAPIQLTAARKGWWLSVIVRWVDDREKHPIESRAYFGREDGR